MSARKVREAKGITRPVPGRATSSQSPSLPSKSGARRKAKRAVPRKATAMVLSSAASAPASKTEGRKRPNHDVPVKAIRGSAASVSPSQTSGKRRKATKRLPDGAILSVPSAASPDPNIGAGGQDRAAGNGHRIRASGSGLSTTLDRIFMLYEQRRDLLATASGLTNRLKALTKIRRGLDVSAKVSEAMIAETDYPPLDTLLTARGVLRDHLKKLEAQLEKLAVCLPAYESFWEPVKGLGPLGLALIVGEAGDLSKYGTHSKLWRRFGLHVGAGKAFYTKRAGMTAANWEEAGYCPRRRSIVYQLTDSMLKAQIRKDPADPEKRIALGGYGELYLREKERQREKAAAEGITVLPAAEIPKAEQHRYRSEGHIHNRVARYVGKKLLRDLWKVWRREVIEAVPQGHTKGASRPPSVLKGIELRVDLEGHADPRRAEPMADQLEEILRENPERLGAERA